MKNRDSVQNQTGMENPLISIIVPTYNRADSIRNSVKSICEQTYTNIEIVVVDDCSTDNTTQVIAEIEDERIKLVKNKKNMGAAEARNIGVKNAKASIIAFQDSDDIWNRDKLERQMQYWKVHQDCDMVYSRYMYYAGNEVCEIPERHFTIDKLEGDIFYSLLEGNKVGTPTVVIKKETFNEVGGFDTELHALEDWELAIKVAQSRKIGFYPEPTIKAYGSERGVNSNLTNLIDAQIYIIRKYRLDEECKKHMQLSITYLLEQIARYVVMTNDMHYEKKIVPDIITSFSDYNIMLEALKRKIKMEENYHLLSKMWDRKATIKQMQAVAEKEKWRTFAIYGYGKIGKIVCDILKDADLQIDYVIDREIPVRSEFEVREIEQVDSSPDTIVVTVMSDFRTVKNELQKHSNSEIIYIGDLLK